MAGTKWGTRRYLEMNRLGEAQSNLGQATHVDAIRDKETLAPVVPEFSQMTVAQHLAEAKRLIVAATNVQDLQNADSHLKEVLKRSPKNAEAIHLYDLSAAAAIQMAAKLDKEREAQAKAHSQDNLARIRCEQAVTTNLKAPSTSQFAPYSGTNVLNLGKWEYRVQSYVDAENSFGAHIRTPYTCTVQCVAVNACSVIQLSLTQ